MAKGSTSKTLVWILMALLIFGLGGFGITNMSGNLRVIGSVGDQEISVARYVSAVQEESRAYEAQTKSPPISFSKAREIQLDQIALAKLIAFTALDNEAAQMGISVGDKNLADELAQIPNFQGLDGKFDREAYSFFLDRSGRTEAQFESEVRAEMARGLLQQAVLTGNLVNPTYADTLITYLGERRDFTWGPLGATDLTEPLPAPDDVALSAYHNDNAAQFTLPERKRITYAWLSPDMILDQVEVDEEVLKKQYEDRSAEFNQPERRLVERLVFSDDAAAEAAKASIEAGETSFEKLVSDRGLALADVDLGDVLQSDLGDAGQAVFAADPGAVVGPFASGLGPALFRMNTVLAARTTSFEEAREALREELALDRARRQIDTAREDIDNLLAGGATLDEIADETDMQLGQVDWTADSSDGPAGYAAFRDEAAKVTIEDFPSIIALDDGAIVALRLDEVLAPELQPLDSVREAVTAAWTQAETSARLQALAEDLLAQITADSDMAALGLTVTQESEVTRGGFIPGTTPEFLDAVFAMQPGEARSLATPSGALIVRLDAVHDPDMENSDIATLQEVLANQASSSQSQDLFQYFINDVQSRAGLRLDQTAINAVNAGMQ
ncbi:SurA N-terminal domain-containing protein [Alisedimentitalea sp. MJ-SS2]|uniref:peptidylprolyl isomerase n=1 Tax=Aliisedimentitalea sp. MJ-SS2 TaxID=3049795 RepID=UPI00290FE4A3|nr:peptidyl-prolyl cis-trans isomerase [Alisedimentitalea sp. MJ-SS2]MDU8929731.1 SurA N-terminal domain-containing protein [Alisedimentitalea sp. MJ-SS2]